MGTWAIDALGNDDAADWLSDLYDGDSLKLIEQTLSSVLVEDYLDAGPAKEALAAAEAVAYLQGRPDGAVPIEVEVEAWARSSKLVPTPGIVEKAHEAIDRILADESELRDLWQHSDELETWKASVLNLRSRIR